MASSFGHPHPTSSLDRTIPPPVNTASEKTSPALMARTPERAAAAAASAGWQGRHAQTSVAQNANRAEPCALLETSSASSLSNEAVYETRLAPLTAVVSSRRDTTATPLSGTNRTTRDSTYCPRKKPKISSSGHQGNKPPTTPQRKSNRLKSQRFKHLNDAFVTQRLLPVANDLAHSNPSEARVGATSATETTRVIASVTSDTATTTAPEAIPSPALEPSLAAPAPESSEEQAWGHCTPLVTDQAANGTTGQATDLFKRANAMYPPESPETRNVRILKALEYRILFEDDPIGVFPLSQSRCPTSPPPPDIGSHEWPNTSKISSRSTEKEIALAKPSRNVTVQTNATSPVRVSSRVSPNRFTAQAVTGVQPKENVEYWSERQIATTDGQAKTCSGAPPQAAQSALRLVAIAGPKADRKVWSPSEPFENLTMAKIKAEIPMKLSAEFRGFRFKLLGKGLRSLWEVQDGDDFELGHLKLDVMNVIDEWKDENKGPGSVLMLQLQIEELRHAALKADEPESLKLELPVPLKAQGSTSRQASSPQHTKERPQRTANQSQNEGAHQEVMKVRSSYDNGYSRISPSAITISSVNMPGPQPVPVADNKSQNIAFTSCLVGGGGVVTQNKSSQDGILQRDLVLTASRINDDFGSEMAIVERLAAAPSQSDATESLLRNPDRYRVAVSPHATTSMIRSGSKRKLFFGNPVGRQAWLRKRKRAGGTSDTDRSLIESNCGFP
ncbi:hypothetical protein PWT90_10806 [Aphanocladium album]|nr:hypothetical protein PWT90_10806 [Aphanocladium album]